MNFNEYQQLAQRTSGAQGSVFRGRVDWKALEHLEREDGTSLPPLMDWSELIQTAQAEKRLMAAAMGLSGEAGELTDYLKKVTAHGHPLDLDAVKKEAGDVLWYVAEVLSCFGISLESVANLNIDKLRNRYGEKFSSEKSINRAE